MKGVSDGYQFEHCCSAVSEPDYSAFISSAWVSLLGSDKQVPVTILRDTGTSNSFVRESILPFSTESATGVHFNKRYKFNYSVCSTV